MNILLVEDDPLLGDGIERGLQRQQFQVAWVSTAAQAEQALQSADFDAVVLDLGLPDRDGMALLAQWRRQRENLPVLILTARDSVEDRLAGLDGGADDYMLKPFDLRELAARLRALVRRAAGQAGPCLEHGQVRLELSSQRVWVADQEVSLSPKELALLQALLQSKGRLLSADQLADRVYGWADGVESNALAVHIHNLRRKCGSQIVETVRGGGYRLGETD